MASFPQAPGVYVQEVPSGARPISAVGTRTAAFLGVAPSVDAEVDKARAINDWTQFTTTYVGDSRQESYLSNAVHGFFLNGGGRCYVVNLGSGGSLRGSAGRPGGLVLLDEYDDIAMVAAPGLTSPDDYDALLSHCEHPLRQDRMAILDAAPPDAITRDDIERLTRSASVTGGQPDGEPAGLRPRQSDGGYGAFYFPWILTRDPISGRQRAVPPSGHIAGVWARSDLARGVHKAPANETLAGATGLTYRVSRVEQELLNPAGVNCIREFPREGIRVWGARTLAAGASEWRYVNVRRLVIMVRESIVSSTGWIVFEPNDETLWRSIRRDVGAFLTQVWRDGALFGRTPEEAFFVKCDEETNPKEVRDAGRVVTVVGIAPVKPAEFVVFQIMQSVGGAESMRVGD